jgi:hypothetical protein
MERIKARVQKLQNKAVLIKNTILLFKEATMKYLYLIFRLFKCPHKWAEYGTQDITRRSDGGTIGRTFILQCKKCGDMKFHKMGAN